MSLKEMLRDIINIIKWTEELRTHCSPYEMDAAEAVAYEKIRDTINEYKESK